MLPIVERLLANNSVDRNQRGRLPRVIVLAPTRELAKQVRLAICSEAVPQAAYDNRNHHACPQHESVYSAW